ncbi:unnamed protein product [Litomosoides sigmodontis]|uniref:Uncharacterized protein n=1 Tax=Litomosoides sigmodontis TaxID=42156 RepID=A0A3P7K8F6_LITSI|nr:unnamed protein product [Litomosoides sigmodontis]
MKLQRLLVASALTSTTPTATTHVITITNTTMHDLTAASKHYNGWNKGKDKLDKRHHANRSHSSAGSDTTIPPAVGSWSEFSGKHKRVNLKQNFTLS